MHAACGARIHVVLCSSIVVLASSMLGGHMLVMCTAAASLTVCERSLVRSSGDLGTVVSCFSLCGLKV
jgi:hypothetical protein